MRTFPGSVLLLAALSTASGQHISVSDATHLKIVNDTFVRLDSLNIQVGSNATIAGPATLYVGTGLVNRGTVDARVGSTVNFTGAGNQSLTGATTFSNLTKSGGGVLILNDSAIVNGTLSLASGKIQLGDYHLTIGSSGTVSGASASNYIITSGSGKLVRNNVGTALALFPVGTSTSYNPLSIRTGAGADNFAARVIPSVSPPSANNNAAVQRTWDFSEGTPGGNGNITITLQWNRAEEGAVFDRASAFSWRHNDTAWMQEGNLAGVTGSDPYTGTVTQVSRAGNYLIANDAILQVQSENGFPGEVRLQQNYPNPFNPSTMIQYQLPTLSHVTLKVYDLLGREVATLVDGIEQPGYKSVTFNAAGLASGMYVYRLTGGTFSQSRKFVLLK